VSVRSGPEGVDRSSLLVPVVAREPGGVVALRDPGGGAEPRPEEQPGTRRRPQASASSIHCPGFVAEAISAEWARMRLRIRESG